MSKPQIDVTEYRQWISKNIDIDTNTALLFSEFVLGTPAFGLSKKERNFYDYYQFQSITDYTQLRTDLLGKIPFKTCETYKNLENELLTDNTINFSATIPDELTEKIYIYTGYPSSSKFLKNKFNLDSSTKGKKKIEIHDSTTEKKDAVAIEKLFYHLRNGLAHGGFSTLTKNNELYYIIQDESSNGFISARMILKLNTLLSWIEYLKNRKKTIETQKEPNDKKQLAS